MAKAPEATEKDSGQRAEASSARVSWNTSHLKSSYCNVANATSTREEVVLNFGVNQNWDRGAAADFEVQLEHRIILSPFAAKRLSDLLARLIKEYESRYGQLTG
jgi:hypothetical protein